METFRRNKSSKGFGGFKSYYVVWKRHSFRTVFRGAFCLNRTMQYGNFKKQVMWSGRYQRLNRTMQYGNKFEAGKKEKYKKCLNRTMQYGNFEAL